MTETRKSRERPLRVLGFVEEYLPPGQTFIHRQMAGLPGCELRMVARRRVSQSPFPVAGVALLSTRDRPFLEGRPKRLAQRLLARWAWLGPLETLRLRRLLEVLRPDVVHAHWAPDAMLVAPLCDRLGIPLLVHFHGYDASRLATDSLYRRHVRILFARMAGAIAVSQHLRDAVVRMGCPPAAVECHYTGVPDEYFEAVPRPSSGASFRLLQVGRLAPKKGLHDSLRAFAATRRDRSEVTFRIVGEGQLREDVENLVGQLNLRSSVQIVGRKTPEEVIREMERADALIVPSCRAPDGDVEGLPNVAVEAMAVGLPVIGTSHAGIPEAVTYSISDWLVPENDTEGLRDRILRLATDVDLRRRLSTEGRAIARARFHLPTQNRRLVEIYARLAAARKARQEIGEG